MPGHIDANKETNIISVVGHPHLGTDHQNLSVVNDDSAVVVIVLVSHRPVHRRTTCQP
jgi:hypothetical protein